MNRFGDHKQRVLKLGSVLALMIPLAMSSPANAVAQPDASVTPSQVEFGNVAVGSSASQTVTIVNTGTNVENPNVVFLAAGTPSVWPIDNDGCSGQQLNPGDSCQITLGFQPDETGYRDGALVLTDAESATATATNTLQTANAPVLETRDQGGISPLNPNGPLNTKSNVGNNLLVIGFSATGMPAPGGAATIAGNRAAGSTLTCDPTDDPSTTNYSYQWLRGGRPVPGATNSTLALVDANVGQSFSCQVVASNPVGAMTMSSPPTAPIAPMSLTLQPGAFTDEGTCRIVQTTSLLRLGRHLVGVSAPQPVTPWAPLELSSRTALRVAIDGQMVATGKRIAISPRTLSNFADGLHSLEVVSPGRSADASLVLLPCSLASRLQGGPGQSTTLAASSLYGMSKLTFRLPAGLRIHVRRDKKLGWATFKSAYYPTRVFDIVGGRTTWNNTTLTATPHTVTVSNLPIETGVVTVTLRSGVLTGRPGAVKLIALERGSRAMTEARTPPTWLP